MEFKIVNVCSESYDLLVVPCFSDELNERYKEVLLKLKESKVFTGKKCTSYFLSTFENKLSNILFLGLGDKKDFNYELFYKCIVSGFKGIKLCNYKNILINLFENEKLTLENMVKAIVLSLRGVNYSFKKYFTKNKNKDEKILVSLFSENEIDEKILRESLNISDAVNLCRDLVNEPANVLTPEEFSNRCKDAVKDLNVDIEVYDEVWIKNNSLHSLYEVGKASVNKPRFIVMKYFGDKDSKDSISFVGKGLMYDSGGYSIKSSDGMVTMKCDMAGGASVLSLITLIAKENLKINVYGIIPACENLINGNGFKPGDVINSLSGKTIEIISTDAEGRLVLADGVNYAAKVLNTSIIIDIATLTGACGIALGTKYAAVIDNNEEIFKKLNKSSSNTTENIWRLPGDCEYRELLKSDIADLKNLGGRYGGTITAGLFIGEFVEKKPWAHIDIAYVSWNDAPTKVFPKKGATGVGVELLYNFCKDNQRV